MQWSVVGENEALLVQECGDTSALLVRKSALTCGFSDEGKLIALVEFLTVANLPYVYGYFPGSCTQRCYSRTGASPHSRY